MLDLHGISRESFDLIVASEVSSREAFERKYRYPEWPGEQSGVTGGIGYDFGQNSAKQIVADWSGKIPDAMVKALSATAGITGPRAAGLARSLHNVVDISWDAALDVFSNHDVPRYLAMCRAHLPGFDALNPHCRGVILSVVFNRGPSFDAAGSRYSEMREIKKCIRSGDLARIPALLRSMERLWPNTRGLRVRREAEAKLFERGLAISHPEEHAKIDSVPPVVDPETVERVQSSLRELGYYQVGAVDGTLTKGGKTEAAILAFRNEHGLPLTPTIDDEFLAALAKAKPHEVSEERQAATVDTLRHEGSETIGFTDKVKAWAGKLFGSGGAIGGSGLIALITEKATAIGSVKEAVGALGLSETAWVAIAAGAAGLIVLAVLGLAIWFVADRIEQRRLADYRTGKHP